MLKTRLTKYIASHSAKNCLIYHFEKRMHSAITTLSLHCNSSLVYGKKVWSYNIFHYRQYIASLAAAEKRIRAIERHNLCTRLRARNCGVQTMPLPMHHEGENCGKIVF